MLPSTLLQRFVAFGGPYISIAAGYLTTLLFTHVTFLGNLGLDRKTVAADLTKLGVFAVSAGVTYAGHHKWLDNLNKLWAALAVDQTSSLSFELANAAGTAPAELPLPVPAPAPVADHDPASTVAATITPTEEVAVQPPSDVEIPQSATTPDGPDPISPAPPQS